MEATENVRIVVAERLNEGLVIKFDDGKCAFYSAVLLYGTFTQAEELDETETLW